jgi:hypothetical protein
MPCSNLSLVIMSLRTVNPALLILTGGVFGLVFLR